MFEVKVTQLCPILCDTTQLSMEYSRPENEWVASPFSRGSSQPRDQIQVSRIAGGFFTNWAIREDKTMFSSIKKKKLSQFCFPDMDSVCTMVGKGPLWRLIKVNWAQRVGHWSSRISVFMRRNTRDFSFVSVSLSLSLFPTPSTCEDTGRSHPGKREFLPEPDLAGALIWDL